MQQISGNVWIKAGVHVEDADDATVTLELSDEVVTIYHATLRVKTFRGRKFLWFEGVTEQQGSL
jgi:hypothetical protein